MAGFRRYELIEHSSPFFFREASIFAPTIRAHSTIPHCFPPLALAEEEEDLSFALDDFNPPSLTPTLVDLAPWPCDPVTDELLQIETTPFGSSSYCKRVRARRCRGVNELYLQSLCDRVSALEWKFNPLLKGRGEEEALDRKYTWKAEIKDGLERKYELTAEIEGRRGVGEKKKKGKVGGERSYKWEAEFKGKGGEKRTYTWKATIGGKKGEGEKKREMKEKKKKEDKESGATRIVEIEEPLDHSAVVLRQAFARRVGTTGRGKKKELSPQDAAMMIQLSFRDYLIRRSRALRALRELAAAKTKLKEIRAMFHNFSYRSRVARDAEERQKFSEKIIILLLTVDAIEGVDLMVRSAKRSMVDELEAMLDVVDPQPSGGKSLSMRRRTFDMPAGDIHQEIAEGVAQVVQMIDKDSATSEA